MQTILEKLYYGNVRFDDNSYAQNILYRQATHRRKEIIKCLEAMLDDAGKATLGKYIDAEIEVERILLLDTFARATKFGVLFMGEIFGDRDGIIDE